MAPSGVEINPQFYWGKKDSFSMRKTSYCGILVKVWRPHYQSNRRFYADKERRKKRDKKHITFKIPLSVSHRICNGIFNHTLLCEFHQGKLLLHLTISFEEKPKTNLPSDNLKYYRQRKQMTTRQLAEKMDIVPSTVVMYENGKHPIPYNVAIKLADVLEIEASLLYDDFSRFLSVPYTEALKSVRTALGLSQKAFAERIGLAPSYYYKIEEGNRRPSRKVYQKIYAALETTSLQTSLLGEHPLQ